MKVGLITFHYAHHYGAQLQAYALRKTVEKLGYPCEIIDYVRPDTTDGNRLFKKGASLRALLSNCHTLLHYGAFKRRSDRFNAFARDCMNCGAQRYTTIEALMEDPPAYDTYICGSDQIWNPMIFTPKDFDPAFFLPFAGNKKRIAYAPSFGIDSVPEHLKNKLKDYLQSFDFLSVREASGAGIIRELLDVEADVVLDPTLLLEEQDWSVLCSDPDCTRPYLLCYFVSDPTPYFSYIEAVSGRLGLPVVTLCGSRVRIPKSRAQVYDAGPREFLGLFKNAGFVMTNSFHGTAFSVLFRRNFLCFENKGKLDVNSRLYNILEMLGLTNRLISTASRPSPCDAGYREADISYDQVHVRLDQARTNSLRYLEEALCGSRPG